MRKRNIQKIVRFNRKEAQDLAAKAKKACLSEAGLIRLLIRGYELILSILVDTFISKISLTMQPGPKIDSISGA